MAHKEKGLVLNLFADEAAADAALESLKAWDKLEDDLTLSAIGTIVLDEDGQVKIHKVGRLLPRRQRRWGRRGRRDPGWMDLHAGRRCRPLRLFELHRKNLRVTPEQRGRLSAELTNGKAAVAVLVTREELAAVLAKLTGLGGSAEEPIEVEMTPEMEAAAAKADAEATVKTVG